MLLEGQGALRHGFRVLGLLGLVYEFRILEGLAYEFTCSYGLQSQRARYSSITADVSTSSQPSNPKPLNPKLHTLSERMEKRRLSAPSTKIGAGPSAAMRSAGPGVRMGFRLRV